MFLEYSLPIISLIFQNISLFIYLKVFRKKSNRVFLLAILILILYTINNIFIEKKGTQLEIELIIIMTSVLLLTAVIGIFLHEYIDQQIPLNPRFFKLEKENLTKISLLLGLVVFLISGGFVFLSFSLTKESFYQEKSEKNNIILKYVDYHLIENPTLLKDGIKIAQLWNKINPLFEKRNLIIFDKKGEIIFNSENKILKDKHSEYLNIEAEEKLKIAELIRRKSGYGNFTLNLGKSNLISFLYNPSLETLIIVHTPKNQINTQLKTIIIPWVAGASFVSLVLLPASIGLLLLVFFISQNADNFLQEALKKSLAQKELLLKELHHRVKNNLQIVYSLIGLQKKYFEQEKEKLMLTECQQRIKSMGMIHEILYNSADLANVNFPEYIKILSANLLDSYKNNQEIKITTDIRNENIDIDSAIPCGLIINELVSNSLKHAFKHQGKIHISFFQNGENYYLSVKDDGKGFVTEKEQTTLGLKLVNNLTKQLKGTIEIKMIEGTEFIVSFPTPKATAERKLPESEN